MEKTYFVAALAVILVLSGAAMANDLDTYLSTQGATFQKTLDNWGWMNMAVAALLICVFGNLIIYMAGYALESEQLKRYAVSEFIQVSASGLMIFFAVALVYGLTNGTGDNVSAISFMGDVLGGSSAIDCAAVTGGKFNIWGNNAGGFGNGPLGAFKCKVQEKINALDRAYNNVFAANMPRERSLSICYILLGFPVWCNDWDLDSHKEVEQNHLVATKIVGLLMPLHAQYSLAEYLQKNMLAVFLPLGLLLRILPFTRGVGGLFIAIAIGFFFVWPTFFLLTDPSFVKQDAKLDSRMQGVCYSGFTGTAVIMANSLSWNGPGNADAIASASGAELVFQITIATLFYPFVALVITLAFIRSLTPILGGDLGELMKMVSRLG